MSNKGVMPMPGMVRMSRMPKNVSPFQVRQILKQLQSSSTIDRTYETILEIDESKEEQTNSVSNRTPSHEDKEWSNATPSEPGESKLDVDSRLSLTSSDLMLDVELHTSLTTMNEGLFKTLSESVQSLLKEKDQQSIAKVLEKKIDEAAKRRRIFTLQTASNETLQKVLFDRGWMQKLTPQQLQEIEMMTAPDNPHLKQIRTAFDIMRKIPSHFVWTNKPFEHTNKPYFPFYSRLQKRPLCFDFSCKVGLAKLYEQLYWMNENSEQQTQCLFPRSYSITNHLELEAFIADFHLTICSNFLYYLYMHLYRVELIFAKTGVKPIECITFALDVAMKAIDLKQHCDLDYARGKTTVVNAACSAEVFSMMQESFIRIMKYKLRIMVPDEEVEKYRELIHKTVTSLLQYFPHIPNDGSANVWIVKPVGGRCGCGFGITVSNNEKHILKMIVKNKYVVQKYIERPLLVHNTKFDIRQYILFTMRKDRLAVWMYKNCYLKFSTQEYSLDNFTPAIHVTNHTVQKKLRIERRSDLLPSTNMWQLEEFVGHLQAIGQPDVWAARIYPGFVAGIKTVVHAALEGLHYVENNFQLFGADFLVTSDFVPVLLEVNASPDLSHSTPVTRTVCSAVVEDMVKVVVDGAENEEGATGDFEKIMDINMQSVPAPNLLILGRN